MGTEIRKIKEIKPLLRESKLEESNQNINGGGGGGGGGGIGQSSQLQNQFQYNQGNQGGKRGSEGKGSAGDPYSSLIENESFLNHQNPIDQTLPT